MIFLLTKFTSGKKLQFTSLLAMRSNLVLFCNPLKQNWKIKRCSYPLTRQEQWFVQQRKTLSRLYYEPGIKKELTFETIFITVFIVFIALQNKKNKKNSTQNMKVLQSFTVTIFDRALLVLSYHWVKYLACSTLFYHLESRQKTHHRVKLFTGSLPCSQKPYHNIKF